MKKFESIQFSFDQCRKEVSELQKWLKKNHDLKEHEHIRPFFEKHRSLAAFIGSFHPGIVRFDRLAFQ